MGNSKAVVDIVRYVGSPLVAGLLLFSFISEGVSTPSDLELQSAYGGSCCACKTNASTCNPSQNTGCKKSGPATSAKTVYTNQPKAYSDNSLKVGDKTCKTEGSALCYTTYTYTSINCTGNANTATSNVTDKCTPDGQSCPAS